ncbi:hypothetical protein [Bacillus sp. FJAT-26390]|uniref:hypothetical protein n=1 Tax=Bacillus sp. FJAT-26390 TaxID=1743142 RepID=UPI000807F834|nr:hypothetical protein [Bacillus sp. FJAT-26390]OBZ13310.1 hypothetical protein A7975_10655 [Bacillus sp. FJAT-26390]
MAKPLPNRIETYQEYEELLARLVAGAKKLSDPLLDDEERARYMQAYNRIDKLLGDYSERMVGKWDFLNG